MSKKFFPRLFEPIKIGPAEIRNRLYMTAHGLGYAVPDPHRPGYCLPSERHLHYYAERAAGGIGLIIQESTVVHPSSEGSAFGYQTATVAAAFDPGTIPHFAKVAEAVHAEGATIFMQLWHGGHHADPRWEPGGPRRPSVSASPTPAVESTVVPRAMSIDDIQDVINGFATSARNARDAGYDGVEIQAAHSALVEQFLSPFYNQRTDGYGGDMHGRLRFLRETLAACRQAAGDGIAIGIRLNTDELLPGGLSADDFIEIATLIDADGVVDFLDLDIGTMHTAPLMIASSFAPEHPAEDFIAALRPAIKRATMLGCPGRMTDPAEAERLIIENKMDMVGGARAFIAEPHFARNAASGDANRNRRCIACNHCLEGILSGVNCVINPATGREKRWGERRLAKAETPKQVAIIGGGPSGLEAARVAGLRGHRVTLYEQSPALGGALRLASQLPGRESYGLAITWWSDRLTELGVDVRLGARITAQRLTEMNADAILIAAGSQFDATGATGFINAPIPGWDQPHVYTPERFLAERPAAKRHAIVLDEDGQAAGAGIAEMLAENGAEVELVTRWQLTSPRLQANGQFAFVLARLYAAEIKLSPNTYIKQIDADGVTLFNIFTNLERKISDVDVVVLVGSRKSAGGLIEQLAAAGTHYEVIGDAATPRSLFEAAYEGHRIASTL